MTTSYTQTHLGKTIDQLAAKDLTDYFSVDREESLTLEFKSFYQRENDISLKEKGVMRAICAFLNSSGGLLIWGAPKEVRRDGGYKVCSGLLSPVEKRYSKDEFISKLSTKIIPFASPALFRSIEIEEGKYVYLFDVPESEVKPHQFDDRYFIRLDGQSKAAPHYVIDALFKQVKRPVLNLTLKATASIVLHRDDIPGPSFLNPGSRNKEEEFVEIRLLGIIENIVKSVNEKSLFYIVTTDLGLFIDWKINRLSRSIVFNENARKILPHGVRDEFDERILIPLKEFTAYRQMRIITISVTVGGEFSTPVEQVYTYFMTAGLNQNHEVDDIRMANSENNPKVTT